MARQTAWLSLVSLVMVATGCHSMSGLSLPMQDMSRVPPPGTGSYQVPQAYYNQSSSLDATSMQRQFANQRVSPAGDDPTPLPSTSGASGSGGVVNRYTQSSNPGNFATSDNNTSRGEVVTASYTANVNSAAPGTRSIGDTTTAGGDGSSQSDLPWQP